MAAFLVAEKEPNLYDWCLPAHVSSDCVPVFIIGRLLRMQL
jgi:hypothetical protein